MFDQKNSDIEKLLIVFRQLDIKHNEEINKAASENKVSRQPQTEPDKPQKVTR